MRIKKFWSVCFSLLLISHVCLAQKAKPARGEFNDVGGEGAALALELVSQLPAEAEIYGLLKIRKQDNPILEVPLRNTIRVTNTYWISTYVTQSVGDQPPLKLVIVHFTNGPTRYEMAIATNNLFTVSHPITNLSTPIAFAGSDFWITDFGLEFYHWPQQRIVKKEMRKSRSCRVLESINPNPGPGNYARVLSWVDVETNGLIRAEGYDEKGKLLKEFSIQSFTKVDGKWQLKGMEIMNEQTDSRTRLEFDFTMK